MVLVDGRHGGHGHLRAPPGARCCPFKVVVSRAGVLRAPRGEDAVDGARHCADESSSSARMAEGREAPPQPVVCREYAARPGFTGAHVACEVRTPRTMKLGLPEEPHGDGSRMELAREAGGRGAKAGLELQVRSFTGGASGLRRGTIGVYRKGRLSLREWEHSDLSGLRTPTRDHRRKSIE